MRLFEVTKCLDLPKFLELGGKLESFGCRLWTWQNDRWCREAFEHRKSHRD